MCFYKVYFNSLHYFFMKKIIISLGVVCSGLLFVSAQSVFPHRPPASPSNIILSAPVSTATSSTSNIKYTVGWKDMAKNESSYYVQLLDYYTKMPVTDGYAYANANATSASFYARAPISPVYAFVTASNDFGSNGTSSNILSGAVFSFLKTITR